MLFIDYMQEAKALILVLKDEKLNIFVRMGPFVSKYLHYLEDIQQPFLTSEMSPLF